MYKAFLIKYGEIGIKGKNRYLFEYALMDQIKFSLRKVDGQFEVTKEQGRVYVEALTEYDYGCPAPIEGSYHQLSRGQEGIYAG